MPDTKTNVLYYGDNLEVLRKHLPDASVDLIYLDPPFNSSRNYNVLFRETSGAASAAQIEAFEDTWEWGDAASEAHHQVMTGPRPEVGRMLDAMVQGLGHNPVTAYLAMMAVRLIELHRVLRPTGSLYLHCDPTVSHYLKVLLDAVFGATYFVNEIAWKRTTAHSDAKQGSKHFGRTHDTILFYAKADHATWHPPYVPYEQVYVDTYYKYVDESGRRYWRDNLTAAKPGGDTSYEWKGKKPPSGRYWAYSRANMERLDREGRIVYSSTGMPMYKRFLDEMPGRPVQDIWDDVRGLGGLGAKKDERLGYPTQKPLALLERIINASSNPGDIVLDPFCGCGTAVHAAERLGRRWIGIDITHLAISLIRRRMQDAFTGLTVDVVGEPTDLAGARDLANRDKYQFQWWALDLLARRLDERARHGEGVQPVSGGRKRGADRGIDGLIPYFDGAGQYRNVVVSVKGGGQIGAGMVRDLIGVMQREKADLGLFLTLEPPTRGIVREALDAGEHESAFWKRRYPRVQIVTVEDLLAGKRPALPPIGRAFAQAPLEQERGEQLTLE